MKKNIGIIALITGLSLAATGCASSVAGAQAGGPGGPDGEFPMEAMASATSVETILLEPTSIANTLTYNGTISYSEGYQVVPNTSGKVESIYYDVGESVTAGAVLFTISDKDIRDNIQQLEASLASANASISAQQTRIQQLDGSSKETQLMNLNSNISSAQIEVENAKIKLSSDEIALSQALTKMEDAQRTLEQTQALFDVGGASQSDLDSAQTAYQTAADAYTTAGGTLEQSKLSLTKAEENLANAKKTYDITVNQSMPEEKQTAQDSLRTAQASANSISIQLQQARAKLADTQVTSPVSGVISAKNVELGAQASTATAAYTIITTDTVLVETGVTEQLLTNLQVGDAVTVLVSTVSDEPLTGHITSISPITDTNGTYPVKVEIDNLSGDIKVGMFAEVRFTKEHNEGAFVVTKDAVLTDENDSYVYIVVNGLAKKVVVETGIDSGSEIEIISGLSVGDEVIVKGQNYVIDGEAVNVIGKENEEDSMPSVPGDIDADDIRQNELSQPPSGGMGGPGRPGAND